MLQLPRRIWGTFTAHTSVVPAARSWKHRAPTDRQRASARCARAPPRAASGDGQDEPGQDVANTFEPVVSVLEGPQALVMRFTHTNAVQATNTASRVQGRRGMPARVAVRSPGRSDPPPRRYLDRAVKSLDHPSAPTRSPRCPTSPCRTSPPRSPRSSTPTPPGSHRRGSWRGARATTAPAMFEELDRDEELALVRQAQDVAGPALRRRAGLDHRPGRVRRSRAQRRPRPALRPARGPVRGAQLVPVHASGSAWSRRRSSPTPPTR